MSVKIAPSILSADFARLGEAVAQAEAGGADWIHVDVMDGHFVPNITIGPPVVKALRRITELPLDVHLMIEDADRWAPRYAETGAQSVTFHVEAAADPARTAREIRRLGARAGVALKPATPLSAVEDLLGEVDMLLVMTVEPGFGGQSFMEDQLAKVSAARALVSAAHLDVWIQVDGGISRATIARAAEAGANVFVAGSAIYGAPDIPAEIHALRELAS